VYLVLVELDVIAWNNSRKRMKTQFGETGYAAFGSLPFIV
jgi:hypothetical protein